MVEARSVNVKNTTTTTTVDLSSISRSNFLAAGAVDDGVGIRKRTVSTRARVIPPRGATINITTYRTKKRLTVGLIK